jgi:hypothetical protein
MAYLFIFLYYVRSKQTKNDECLFFTLCIVGFASLTQKLNSLGMKYWQSFSNTCYFEPSGVFIVSVYAAPLLVNAFVVMVI